MDDTYVEAAQLLQKLDGRETSFRKLIFDSQNHNKKLLYKICFETMKRRSGFEKILAQIDDLAKNPTFDGCSPPFIQYVLLYEYLFGFGLKKCCNDWRHAVEQHESDLARLKNEVFGQNFSDGSLDNNDSSNGNDVKNKDSKASFSSKSDVVSLPRYARVNTLKISVEEAKAKLCTDGWRLIETENMPRKKYRSVTDNLVQYDFCIDIHVPELFVFACGTDLHREELVTNGCLMLQDKSSCLPPICLDCKPGSHVMDLCAAPGVKTSHIAALLHNEGKVFAYDKNFDRYKLMEGMLNKTGVNCAQTQCYDILRLNMNDKMLRNVKYALLDPPCSGSGMVKRLDFLTDDVGTKDEFRLKKLANLQSMMLKHALTLPNLQRLVYSTCSVHEEENEQVVQEVLDSVGGRFELVEAMPHWKHRGRRSFEFGRLCLRASPDKDRTNGFFVAVFQKTTK